MNWLSSFWKQPSKRYRNFQMMFTVLSLNFLIPACTYALMPEIVGEQIVSINKTLGGAPYTFPEAQSRLWRYLGAANVMTLGLMCVMLQVNIRRFYVVLLPLTFLKAYNASLFLFGYIAAPHYPVLLVVALFDYLTSAAFLYFTIRAHRDLKNRSDEELVPSLKFRTESSGS